MFDLKVQSKEHGEIKLSTGMKHFLKRDGKGLASHSVKATEKYNEIFLKGGKSHHIRERKIKVKEDIKTLFPN